MEGTSAALIMFASAASSAYNYRPAPKSPAWEGTDEYNTSCKWRKGVPVKNETLAAKKKRRKKGRYKRK